MTFKEFKENPTVKFLSNRYFLILLIFTVWMIFFDENSFLNHYDLDKEIDKLEKSVDYHKKEINHDKKIIKDLKHPDSLEKFAREEYNMKKKNEDIYIIEFDTIEK